MHTGQHHRKAPPGIGSGHSLAHTAKKLTGLRWRSTLALLLLACLPACREEAPGAAPVVLTDDGESAPEPEPAPEPAPEPEPEPEPCHRIEYPMADGEVCSICTADFEVCDGIEVPDGQGGCRASSPGPGAWPDPLPSCAADAIAIAGRCVEARPRLGCSGGDMFPEIPPALSDRRAHHVLNRPGDDPGDGSRGRPFRTLQAAIDAAGAGDVLLVGAGTYAPFRVDRPLAIIGLCPALTVVRSADGPAIRTHDPNQRRETVIDELWLQGIGISGRHQGMWLQDIDALVLRQIEVDDAVDYGVAIHDVREASLTDIEVSRIVGEGVVLDEVDDAVIERLDARLNSDVGLALVGVRRAAVRASSFTYSRLSLIVDLDDGDRVEITDSLMGHARNAALVVDSREQAPDAQVEIHRCQVESHPAANDDLGAGAAIMARGARVDIADSLVWHNRVGVHALADAALEVNGSRFTANADFDILATEPVPASAGRAPVPLSLRVEDSVFESAATHLFSRRPNADLSVVDSWFVPAEPAAESDATDGDERNGVVCQGASTCTVEGSVFDGIPDIAAKTLASRTVSIVRNRFESVGHAAMFFDADATFAHNQVRGTRGMPNQPPLAAAGVRGDVRFADNLFIGGDVGAVIAYGGRSRLSGNVVVAARHLGIRVQAGRHVVADNVIACVTRPMGLGSGVEVLEGADAEVRGNTLLDNETGLILSIPENTLDEGASTRIVVSGNHISSRRGRGVQISDFQGQHIEFVDNTIVDNVGEGIAIFGAEVLFRDNTIGATRLGPGGIFGANLLVVGRSRLDMQGDRILDAALVGIDLGYNAGLHDEEPGAELTARGITVSGNGRIGLDAHVQTRATISGSAFVDNAHSAVVARRAEVEIVDSVIRGSRATDRGPYGDGVHAVLGASVVLERTRVEDNERAGVILDDAIACLESIALSDNGTGVIAQRDAELTDIGSCRHDPEIPVTWLDDASALPVDRAP